MGQRGYGKGQCGSCHGRLSEQAALLELCYLSAAESQPAVRGGTHCSEAGHTLRESFLIRLCGQSSTCTSFNA